MDPVIDSIGWKRRILREERSVLDSMVTKKEQPPMNNDIARALYQTTNSQFMDSPHKNSSPSKAASSRGSVVSGTSSNLGRQLEAETARRIAAEEELAKLRAQLK